MKITEVTVSASQSFNHPYESYANFKPGVTIRAEVQEGEDSDGVIKQLQAKAEGLVQDHKVHLLATIEKIQELKIHEQEVASLSREITRAQNRLDEIREKNPELGTLQLSAD